MKDPLKTAGGAARIPKYAPGETVPGLECSYGTLAYCYSDTAPDLENVTQKARRHGCHNPIESPDERHHCPACGGDYCEVHAEPASHDCEYVVGERLVGNTG